MFLGVFNAGAKTLGQLKEELKNAEQKYNNNKYQKEVVLWI